MAARRPTKAVASKGSGDVAAPTKKKVVAKKAVKTVAKPAPKKTTAKKTFSRDLNPKTGFVKGSQQDIIATELIKGGATRVEVIERLRGLLPTETRNGSPKPVSNLVSGVWREMKARGFEEKSSYKVVAPKKG